MFCKYNFKIILVSPDRPQSTRLWPWCRRPGEAGPRCPMSEWTWSVEWSPPGTPGRGWRAGPARSWPRTRWPTCSTGRRWWSSSRRTPAWRSAPPWGSCIHLRKMFFLFTLNFVWKWLEAWIMSDQFVFIIHDILLMQECRLYYRGFILNAAVLSQYEVNTQERWGGAPECYLHISNLHVVICWQVPALRSALSHSPVFVITLQ